MRPTSEQAIYAILDIQDQPQSKYVLFVNGTPYSVDDMSIEGDYVVGWLTPEGKREVVVGFPQSVTWRLVRRSCLEIVTQGQAREHYLEGLPELMRAQVRAKRVADTYKGELAEDGDPGEQFRRLMGDQGWGESL